MQIPAILKDDESVAAVVIHAGANDTKLRPVWTVFRAKDYLPKLTVVYFLRVRRGTSQHQTRETNAGGGGVCRNTRRVKPTPEEEEYVATKDAGGGGVCHNTKPTPEEEYVATTVN